MATAPSESLVRPDRLTLLAFVGVLLFGSFNAIAVKQSVEESRPLCPS